MDVDFIIFSKYKDIDLAGDPVVIPPCGHLQTISSFDSWMDMAKFYCYDENENIINAGKNLQSFESSDIKACAHCRGSLRSINRYNRIVKRGLIDEATKRFIVWANAGFVQLEQRGHKLEKKLSETMSKAAFQTRLRTRFDNESTATAAPIDLHGSSTTIVGRLCGLSEIGKRYDDIWQYRKILAKFSAMVATQEQPFRRVWDLCRSFTISQDDSRDLVSFEEAADSALNTRSHLLARSLLLHTDVGILGDFVEVWTRSRVTAPMMRALSISTEKARQECETLHSEAVSADQPVQQVEALLNWAFFAAAELRCPRDPAQVGDLRELAVTRVELASTIVEEKPSAAALASKIKSARIALNGEFQSVVTDDEMRAVYAAMATQFRGTGHWYRCQNGHPVSQSEHASRSDFD